MRDKKENTIGGIIFLAVIIFLIVGGFIFTKNVTKKSPEEEQQNSIVACDEYKIDKNKDFVYYGEEKVISSEPDITYKDIIINLTTAESINNTLKNELNTIRNSVKLISDNELDSSREVLYKEENIYSASERNYETYLYNEYLTVIVKDYDFNCYDGSILKNVKCYVFNLKTGHQLLNPELLDLYEVNTETIKDKTREKLTTTQTTTENGELIKIDETILNLDNPNNYALYIDKYGDLYASIVVKTIEVDYNENIKLN